MNDTFIVEVPGPGTEAMDQFQEAMDAYHAQALKDIQAEALKLGISDDNMSDIWYLRSRSRWTQRKEDFLISLAKAGEPLPPIMDDFVVPGEF